MPFEHKWMPEEVETHPPDRIATSRLLVPRVYETALLASTQIILTRPPGQSDLKIIATSKISDRITSLVFLRLERLSNHHR
jgi:hypothetical protein